MARGRRRESYKLVQHLGSDKTLLFNITDMENNVTTSRHLLSGADSTISNCLIIFTYLACMCQEARPCSPHCRAHNTPPGFRNCYRCLGNHHRQMACIHRGMGRRSIAGSQRSKGLIPWADYIPLQQTSEYIYFMQFFYGKEEI